MDTRLTSAWRLLITVDSVTLKCFAYHHTPYVLQPLNRTVYKPLRVHCQQEATGYTHGHSQTSINIADFGRLISASWSESTTTDVALKGFQCAGLYPDNISIL
jgi:hypothetical protein